GNHNRCRSAQSACTKPVRDDRMDITSGRRQQPGLVHQFGEVDCPSTCPSTLQTCCHNHRVGVQDFRVQVIFAEGADQIHDEVDIARFELAIWRGSVYANELK